MTLGLTLVLPTPGNEHLIPSPSIYPSFGSIYDRFIPRRRYGTKLASPALSYLAEVDKGETTFAWLLLPTTRGVLSGASTKVMSENSTHVVVLVEYEFPPPAIGRTRENVTVDVRPALVK